MFRQAMTVVLCAALATTGCASAAGPRVAAAPAAPIQTTSVLADYVQRLPAGSRVRVERTSGPVLRGTLMKSSRDSMVVQKNTRVPEAPIDIPLTDVTRVTIETHSGSVGRNIAIGVATGVGATFAVLLLLAAAIGD